MISRYSCSTFEPGQARQPHLEDGVRLDLAELELAHEALACDLHVLRAADQGDDGVEVVEGDLEALEDVGALLGLGEVELGAAPHDLLPVEYVLVHQLAQVHHLRPVLHQGQHDRAEGHLQRGVDEELVEHDLRVGVLLELDHDAHAVAVGLVAQVADARDPPLAHQTGDLLEQARLADLERDLGRHQAHAPGTPLFDLNPRAHLDEATPGRVAVPDALDPVDDAARGEIRSLDDLGERLGRGVRVLDDVCDGVAHLAEVVRRHLGRHAYRDARAAVDEQVRQHTREHGRLLEGLVVVGPQVDRILLEVREHLDREVGEAGLGVAHGRRGVAVDGTKVALAVHQRIAHDPALGQTHERRVDHALAVRVVVARGVTGDLGALPVAPSRREIQVVHCDQDAALRGLEPVADIGERARDDDRHRVVDVAGPHLIFDRHVDDSGAVVQCHALIPASRPAGIPPGRRSCRLSARRSRGRRS
jgi:hypothetical protein